MSEISKSGEDLIERQITAAQIREDNIDPVNGPLLNSVNNIRQYDFDTNKDRVFTPLGNGPGFVQIAEVEPELVTTSNIGTNFSIPIPKHMDSNGLNEYYANLGRASETFIDPIVTGAAKGVDMFTDMASDFLGKYIQVKFDPNLFDGKSMPEINPKQILMDSVGFEGLDLSEFEPETTGGKVASDIISYIVAGTLTPGGPGSFTSKALTKDVGALLSTGPELGNIFTAMEALGLENEIVSFFNAYMLDPDNAAADERLASRIKATIDAPLFAGALFVAAKTLGNRAFQLAAATTTGTALSAQEAEGGPLATFVRQSLKRMNRNVTNDVSYRIQHQPKMPEDGAPRLDNLTKDIQGNNSGYPNDFYSNDGQRLYAQGPRFKDDQYGIANSESYNIILSAKNNPEMEVTIYRSVPNEDSINEINVGDFVTLSPTYAKLHSGSGYGDGGNEAGKILSKRVKVKEIFFDGNDVNEFGYFPEQTTTSEQIQTIVDNAKQAYEKKPNNENLKQEYFRLRKLKDKFLSKKKVDNLSQPGAVNQVDNTVYQRNDKGDLVPETKIDPEDNIARIEAPTDNEPGIIAFHGSGADFDEFKLDKIGSGEGAQMFGYGLYFTEVEDIAKYYKNTLSTFTLSVKGKEHNLDPKFLTKPQLAKALGFENYKRNKDSSLDEILIAVGDAIANNQSPLKALEQRYKKIEASKALQSYGVTDAEQLRRNKLEAKFAEEDYIATKNALIEFDLKIDNAASGKTYKVALSPKPEELLDYDLPFSEQSDYVKKNLRNYKDVTLGDDPEYVLPHTKLKFDDNTFGQSKMPRMVFDAHIKKLDELLQSGADVPGSEIIKALKNMDGTGQRGSQFLNELGIKGIKYRSAANRSPDMVDRLDKDNFVIFDDAAINILAKYGIAGPVAVTALSKPEPTKNEQ